MRISNGPDITEFKDIFNWIIYDLDDGYSLSKDGKGNFYVNKLYIDKKHLTYKTECLEIAEGLFEKVAKLHALLNED